ncbi:unnamed protein product [Rotaria sp. Silwood1]|nr:unnamed protein product [Rotaria sp. Silwood1]
MDVPNDSHTILHLIHEVNEQTNPEQYSSIVHCITDTDRTGTYIAIDAMIEKIHLEEKSRYIYFVLQMCRGRDFMI